MFLNATSVREGDWISLRCMLPDTLVTRYFFCKDGQTISSHRAMLRKAAYTLPLHISQQSAGRYSCGYQKKDGKNQEKTSARSAAWTLTVLPGSRPTPLQEEKEISSMKEDKRMEHTWIKSK
ncbi:hypothetical protein lerEdw1_010228 [Lerista edwardsae]|nr:hypothetical protein lerEdw1_010228 [Lerista edwardsae]